jgi:GTP-binding protein
MKKCPFTEARFLTSALDKLPEFRDKHGNILLEVVIAGRSNVGKSSLINHLFNHKNLARVSSTPGKTQTINFFEVDGQLILVDLPGYGYAKRPRETQKSWAASIDNYFQNRATVILILLLIDSRHPPSKDDIAFAQWASHFNKPFLIIFTKCDTLSEHERKKNTEAALNLLNETDSVYYSIKEARSRKVLADKINTRIAT